MKKFISSVASFVAIVLCALLGLSLVAFAARGPCAYTQNPQTSSSIGCSGKPNGMCSGQVYMHPGCESCRNQNESNCTDGTEGTATLYLARTARCSTDGECGIDFTNKSTASTGCLVNCEWISVYYLFGQKGLRLGFLGHTYRAISRCHGCASCQ